MGMILGFAIVILLTLAALTYLAGVRAADKREEPPVYALLPGDIKYESPSGNFRVYFPVTTSIVLSVVLTLALWLFS